MIRGSMIPSLDLSLESSSYESEHEPCQKHEHQGGQRRYKKSAECNNTNPSTEPPQSARHQAASQHSHAAPVSCGIECMAE